METVENIGKANKTEMNCKYLICEVKMENQVGIPVAKIEKYVLMQSTWKEKQRRATQHMSTLQIITTT